MSRNTFRRYPGEAEGEGMTRSNLYEMPSSEHDSLRQNSQAAIHTFRASIRDLVVLVDNSAADTDLVLAHRNIRVARHACEVARDALEHHRKEHGC
jgi:hypothetical protein